MKLQQFLKERGKQVEDRLEELIPKENSKRGQLFESARYSLFSPGKRLRPILTLAATETFKKPPHLALDAACALEMIHTYSLIHDDLPCMDDDDFRRGKPSLHKVYTEGHAVLTGDFLLTYAFEILATLPHLEAEKKLELTRLLAYHSGGHGMIGGQVLDIAHTRAPLDLQTIEDIHARKTGALILASLEFGTVIGEATESERKAIRQFGQAVGLGYQIVDDLLDNDPLSYANVVGRDQAEKTALELLDIAHTSLTQLPQDTSLLKDLANTMIRRKI